MPHADQGPGLQQGNAELFAQLALERLPRGFAGLDLAAGKFPFAGGDFPFRPLRNQNFTVPVDETPGSYRNYRAGRGCNARSRCQVRYSAFIFTYS